MNKTQTILLMVAVLFCLVFGGIAGYVGYNYQLEKCQNLKTSNYQFDIKLETNAGYAENCYYVNNHPLAMIDYVCRGMAVTFAVLLIIGSIGSMIYMFIDMAKDGF